MPSTEFLSHSASQSLFKAEIDEISLTGRYKGIFFADKYIYSLDLQIFLEVFGDPTYSCHPEEDQMARSSV